MLPETMVAPWELLSSVLRDLATCFGLGAGLGADLVEEALWRLLKRVFRTTLVLDACFLDRAGKRGSRDGGLLEGSE